MLSSSARLSPASFAYPRPGSRNGGEIFGHERFLIQFTVGTMPHESVLRAIELLGTKVAPVVWSEVERRTLTSAA
jgi:hypothetical protein